MIYFTFGKNFETYIRIIVNVIFIRSHWKFRKLKDEVKDFTLPVNQQTDLINGRSDFP